MKPAQETATQGAITLDSEFPEEAAKVAEKMARDREGVTLHDGGIYDPKGCPRGRTDCQPLSLIPRPSDAELLAPITLAVPMPMNLANGRGWSLEEVRLIRAWYEGHEGVALELGKLAARLNRGKTSICRKAQSLGLTKSSRAKVNSCHWPKADRKLPPRKYATETERRAAIGAASRKRIQVNGHPRGMLGKKQKPEVLERARAAAKIWHDNATPEEIAAATDKGQATTLARYGTLSPGLDLQANPYSRCNYGRRADLGDQFFRSMWEANYARYLNFLQARGIIAAWEYEADTFWFEPIRRGVRSYKPDFKVTNPDGSVHYDEVKGWMDAKSITKIKRMAKYYPAIDLRVIDQKAYREIARKLGGAIVGWETDSRKRA
ncbi:MAG TPA: hypothetical protein VII66_01090 [Gemmatimonadaceae bacterium]